MAAAGCSLFKTEHEELAGSTLILGNAKKSLSLEQERSRFDLRGLTIYQIYLRNNSSKRQAFEYRIKWLDKENIEIFGATRSWRPLVLGANTKIPIQSVAPNASALECLIEIRTIRPAM